jgi:hypothetical protein
MSAEVLREAADAMRNDAESANPEAIHPDAAWHPAVALTVAELLDEVAGWREEGLGLMPTTNLADAWSCVERQANVVARAYLGSP